MANISSDLIGMQMYRCGLSNFYENFFFEECQNRIQ